MSLKAFHILFIVVAILTSVQLGVWGVQAHLAGENSYHLSFGVLGFVAALGLLVYGVWFLRKLKRGLR